MLKGSLSHYSPLSQLLLSLLVVVASFLLSLFAGSIFAYLLFDINLFTDTQSLDIHSSTANIPALKFYQSVYSTGMFVVPPFIIAYLVHHKLSGYLFLDRGFSVSKLLLATGLILFSLPVINWLAEVNSHLQLPEFLSGVETWMRNSEQQAEVITKKFLLMENFTDVLVNLVLIAVLPALGEELLFRGVLQQIFVKMTKSPHWGIAITAFLFAALHMQFFGLLPRMGMGILFGYLLLWTKNLWVPIFAHMANNGLAVISSYFIGKGGLSKEFENIGSDAGSQILVPISLFFVAGLLTWFYRTRERQC